MLQCKLEVEKMEHILKLQPKYFEYIKNGTKRIELRLYDEKRQKIAIGDTIILYTRETKTIWCCWNTN